MKGTLLVKNVKHLVTCDANDRLLDGVDVFVKYRTWSCFHG